MKLWDISGDGRFWKVQLDVRDLGGHLDFTRRARAGTLSERVGEATIGVAVVGALPLWFQVKLGLVRGKLLPAGLHAAEASYVSSSSTAIVRAVWSCKMPLPGTFAILNLQDGPVGIDPAFHLVHFLPLPHPCCMLGSFLSFPLLWPLIVVIDLVACYGVAGCQGLVMLVRGTLGRPLLAMWLAVSLRVVWVLIRAIPPLFGFRLIIGTLMILLWKCLILLIFGRMLEGNHHHPTTTTTTLLLQTVQSA